MPPRNPYLPVEIAVAGQRQSVIAARRREAIDAFASHVCTSKIQSSLTLSPEIDDVRPFLWRQYQCSPRYTYVLDLQDNYSEGIEPAVSNKIKKAAKKGYRCEVTTDFAKIQMCLRQLERRKQFDHSVDEAALYRLSQLMGIDKFVGMVSYDKSGDLSGAQLRLIVPGGHAICWSSGMMSHALKDGINQLMYDFTIVKLREYKCTKFDLCGANMPSIATAKQAWGGDLQVYYTIRPNSFRNLARDAYHWLRSLK